jgi:hypothetical protein
MADSDKIVLLKTFDLAIDADLAKAKLDAHGIPCFLSNENGVYPIPTNSMFGVRLMAFKNDVDKANEILNDESDRLT